MASGIPCYKTLFKVESQVLTPRLVESQVTQNFYFRWGLQSFTVSCQLASQAIRFHDRWNPKLLQVTMTGEMQGYKLHTMTGGMTSYNYRDR